MLESELICIFSLETELFPKPGKCSSGGLNPVIRIFNIKERPNTLTTLASWNHDYWRERTPMVGLKDWSDFYQNCIKNDERTIPFTLVAFDQETLVGSVTIVDVDDIRDFPSYTPWIAGVIIQEAYRGMRIGRKLMEAALSEAKQMGFKEIYLWTDASAEWYRQQGWGEIHRLQLGQIEAVVMKKSISDD